MTSKQCNSCKWHKKRYYAHKHLLEENEVHDRVCHNFMGLDETVEHMNNQYWKYKQLKKENLDLSEELDYCKAKCASLETGLFQADKKNEQLKQNCKNYEWYKQYKAVLNENEQLKKIFNELSDMLQFDVENGIRSYPVKLSEYLSNALKELQRID